MSALTKFNEQVSSCINTAFEEIMKHQLAAMFYLDEGDLGFLNFI